MASNLLPYIGLEEVKQPRVIKALAAELVGTAILVLFGCGSTLPDGQTDVTRIALAFGLTVAALAACLGHVSGCHVNPAVTVGLLFGRKIGLIKSALYIIAQIIGGILGAGILYVRRSNNMCHINKCFLFFFFIEASSQGQIR